MERHHLRLGTLYWDCCGLVSQSRHLGHLQTPAVSRLLLRGHGPLLILDPSVGVARLCGNDKRTLLCVSCATLGGKASGTRPCGDPRSSAGPPSFCSHVTQWLGGDEKASTVPTSCVDMKSSHCATCERAVSRHLWLRLLRGAVAFQWSMCPLIIYHLGRSRNGYAATRDTLNTCCKNVPCLPEFCGCIEDQLTQTDHRQSAGTVP